MWLPNRHVLGNIDAGNTFLGEKKLANFTINSALSQELDNSYTYSCLKPILFAKVYEARVNGIYICVINNFGNQRTEYHIIKPRLIAKEQKHCKVLTIFSIRRFVNPLINCLTKSNNETKAV